jgi:hypothetical protein
MLVFALSIVKLLWPLEEFFSCFHDQDLRAHHIPPCYAPWEVSIVPHFTSHKIKTPHYVIEVSLSIFCYKRDMGYKKRSEKMDTWRSKHTKKRVGHMKVHEKNRQERKIAMFSKWVYKWRVTTHKEFPSTIYHPLYPYTCTSLSDCMTSFSLWIRFLTLQYMWWKYAFSFIPTLKLHIWPSLEVGWRIWASQNALVRTYTPWVIREYQMRS